MSKSVVIRGKKKNAEIVWQERAIREGRGTGAGKSYIPWIQVRRFDFSSHGRSHLVPNPFNGRLHHVLSDLEMHVLLLLLWAPIRDIQEQFPLQPYIAEPRFCKNDSPPQCSVEIASALGYKHPQIQKGLPRYMTTDFLVTRPDGTIIAIYVKYSNIANLRYKNAVRNDREQELLDIAREYWRQRQVFLLEVSELDINEAALRWCIWCFSALDKMASQSIRAHFIECLLNTDSYDCLRDRIKKCAEILGCDKAFCIRLLKQSIFLRELSVDIRQTIDLTASWVINKDSPIGPCYPWHFLSYK